MKLITSWPFHYLIQEGKLSFSYHVVCPILAQRWILLGEASGKFIPISRQRIASITFESGITIGLIGAPGEEVKYFL